MLDKILAQKAMITTILIAVVLGGVFSYEKMGKLEDAEIPMKAAMVITPYPGASAHEVELQVTKVLEEAIQKLENIDNIETVSEPGLSKIQINIQPSVKTSELPQLWDHLRRKVNDAKGSLPSEAYDPIVNDDFADTYGMLYAVIADGYSQEELEKYTEFIERELLDVKGIRRSQLFGGQTETVEIIFSQDKLASLNINPMQIAMALKNQTDNVNPGNLVFGRESVTLGIGNKITSVKEIEELLIELPSGGSMRLGDIATVKQSELTPKREGLYYNGKKGLALGLSNENGVNVVEVGERINQRIEELKEKLPAGFDINPIYSQPDRVNDSVKNFVWNLIMSVVIVIIVLLFSMGLRSGLLISSGLVFTILGTLIVMLFIGLPLHRITLAAIILAMGMLVDNSIVVADGILVDLKRGIERKKAFVATAKKTALPLLGATVVAILAFLPLAMSPDAAGEFLSSLFTVLVISLLLSWVFAIVQTPFMATYFYRKKRPKGENEEAYNNWFYRRLRQLLSFVIKHKVKSLAISVLILIIALFSFQFIKVEFMPAMNYDQVIVTYELPEGYGIESVENDMVKIQDFVQQIDGVNFVVTSLGRPPARYTLMRAMPSGGNNYGELIIETKTPEKVTEIIPIIKEYISRNYPEALARIKRYGPAFAGYDIEVEFTGPDPKVLRNLAEETKNILKDEQKISPVQFSWGNKTKSLNPIYSSKQAQALGISRTDMSNSLLIATTGMPIGSFYKGDRHVPIMLKTRNELENHMENLLSIPVWGQRSMSSVPLNQIIDTVTLNWQDERISRINGVRSFKVQFDAAPGYTPAEAQASVYDKVMSIQLPDGYHLKWDGILSQSSEANEGLFMFLPLALGLMLIIIIGLFNNFRQAAIIFIIVPFAFIGISLGFNLTGSTFTFLAIIGALGLIGMMIKNAVVLLDEINIELKNGQSPLNATINSAINRTRPVMMASLTTILGMLPLLTDVMFRSMAIAIMFGLTVGSVITLIVVPILYAVFFSITVPKKVKA